MDYRSLGRTTGALIVGLWAVVASATGSDLFKPNRFLRRGQSLESLNQRYRFVLQDDGNVVIYRGKAPVWSTNTNEPGLKHPDFDDALLGKLPLLNLRVLDYANSNDGKQVGGGDCWEFVASAMNHVGAKRRDVYVFGNVVKREEAISGDFVQFGTFSSPSFATALHSAIVWKNHNDGRITVIHANASPNGKRVGKLTIDFSQARDDATFFRPTP